MVSGTGANPPHVLLVDDCVPVRDLYELALAPAFAVRTASRGVDGLAIAMTEHPDVVILDVLMPGMDEWEMCVAINSNPRSRAPRPEDS
jgi:CheY-like chemotaxis protein